MKKMKKLIAVILAAVMVLAISIPVFATGNVGTGESPYSITITSMDKNNNREFKAYQIFSGTLSSDGHTLSDVVWGDGVVTIADLLTAIKEIDIGTDENSVKPFEYCITAADVSNVLSEYNTTESLDEEALAEAFADVVASYISTTYTEIPHTDALSDGVYSAEVTNPGYYLVVDDSATNKAGLMLEVVGKVDVTAKVDVSTVSKYAGDEAVTDNAEYSVGDVVEYTLKGTLPSDYDPTAATAFKYVFTDTMDAALDLQYTPSISNPEEVKGDVTVTVGIGESAVDITEKFTIRYTTNEEGKNVLTISSDDIRDIDAIKNGSEIYVTYQAKINNKLNAGEAITNTVALISDQDTSTPEIKEQIFPIQLTIVKKDGSSGKTLPGAEFVLYRENGDQKLYATMGTGDESNKITGWTDDENKASTLTSDADGKISIVGLGAGEFYLKETKAPEGYNELKEPAKLVITAVAGKSATGTGELKTLTIAVNNGTAIEGDLENMSVSADITNNQGAQLPSTGGIGTTIFYIVGIIIVAGVVVILVSRRRMNAGR